MKKLLIGIGIVVVIGIIVVAAVGRKKTPGEPVYVAEVTRGDVVTVVTGTGVIQPRTKVNISSEIYGQIIDLPVKEGQTVHKGELLVGIDPEKYRSEADRLAANLRVNRIAIESEEVALKNFELDQGRANQLHHQGILSNSEREKADLALETSRIRVKSLKESVTQAEAALSRARDDLGKTKIYAPMDGKITQVNTEVGEQVIVGTTNVPGSVILVISDMGEVLAEVSVDETEVVKLRPGQKASVAVEAVEKTAYAGRVTEIRNTAKKEGDINVFGVKILLETPDERLRPGMTAKAKIEVERRENVLRIPLQAVTTRERKKLEDEKKAARSKGSPAETKTKTAEAAKTPQQASAGPSSSSGGSPAESASTSGGSETPSVQEASRREGSSAQGESPGKGTASPAPAAGKPGGESGSAAAPASGKKADEREEIEVVYVMDHDRARGVPVKTGASDDVYVEITGGLEEKESVVKGPYRILKRLKEGDRLVKKEETEGGEESGRSSGGSEGGGER